MKIKLFSALGIGIVSGGLAVILFSIGFFQTWNNKLTDTLFTSRPPHPDIVIIAIDDTSIQRIGRWPWLRSVHAKLLNKIGNRPYVIGLDVAFPEKSDTKNDTALAESLQKTSIVILPLEAELKPNTPTQSVNILRPIPLFTQYTQQGTVNTLPDSDGITRTVPLHVYAPTEQTTDSFSLTIVKKYYEKKKINEQALENIPTEKGLMRIHYTGSTYPTYSFVDVINDKIPLDRFSQKIVLIGATAADLHDTQLTPVSAGQPMSGIEIHANAIQTILDHAYLIPESQLVSILTIFFIAIITSLILSYRGIISGSILTILLLISIIGYIFLSFDSGTVRNIIFPLFTLLLVYIIQILYKYFVENKRKRFIKKALSYYLSDAVMQEVLSDPKKLSLGGSRREMTVLFSDIAGFTTISEKIPAERLAKLLNRYLTHMTEVVFKHNGVLDKYIGDAVMAFWGAPVAVSNHALLACKTALDMQKRIQQLKPEWKAAGTVDFGARIGIHSGEMVVGNMGSDVRFDYTVVGDSVNLASRLEGINKEYGTYIMISEATYQQVHNDVIARCIDIVAVKGKTKGIALYELRGLGKPNKQETVFLQSFEKARKLYHQGKFEEAYRAFKRLKKQFPKDPPTTIFISRCEALIQNPPKAWDGIYHAKSK